MVQSAATLDVHVVGDTTTYVVAVSALLGVIVGGLLNGAVSWLLDRGSRHRRGRVAALLVSEELLIAAAALIDFGKAPTWMTLNRARDFGREDAWQENRALIGDVLVPDAYMTLAAAYRGVAHAAGRASEEPMGEPSAADGRALTSTFLAVNRGMAYLSLLLHMPSVWHPLKRREVRQGVKAQVEVLLLQDANFQGFMAKYGSEG